MDSLAETIVQSLISDGLHILSGSVILCSPKERERERERGVETRADSTIPAKDRNFPGKFEKPIRMKKLIEFGREVMFYVRVISGYEQRRIRAYRFKLDQRLLEAEQKKEALKKLPDEVILGGVRNMVQEMQNLNKRLEEADTAIQDYLKPLDGKVQAIVDLQLKEEAETMKTMLEVMKQQAFQEHAEAEKTANAHHSEEKSLKGIMKALRQQALPENTEAAKTANAHQEKEKQ